MSDLLHLLYDGGDKSKPLSPLVDKPGFPGQKQGRFLGQNTTKDISEWVSMIFLLDGKNKKQGKGANNTSRNYECDSEFCPVCLRIGSYLAFNLLLLTFCSCLIFYFFSQMFVNAITMT